MKHFLTCMILLLTGFVLSAQEAPDTSTQPTTDTPERTAPNTQAAPSDQAEQAPKKTTKEVPIEEDSSINPPPPSSYFDPSEHISEDLSVSFPVDI